MRLTARRGLLPAAALLTAASLAPAASATPGATARILAGTTVIATGSPAYEDVVVPRDAWVSTPHGSVPDLTASPHKNLAGFALVGTGGRARGTVLIGGADGEVPFLLPLPTYPAGVGGSYGGSRTYTDQTPVRAGTYRLYSFGTKATLTLRLRNLTGRANVTPRRRATVEVARNDVDAGGTTNDYTGVGTRRLASPGVVFEVLTMRYEASAAWQLTMCYKHSRPDMPESAWSRGCPDAESFTTAGHRYPDLVPASQAFVQGVVGAPRGDVVQTAWITAAANVSSIDFATVWMTL